MEGDRPPILVPVQRSRAFRQFKNPPQPHMCICDTIYDSSEKLYINVLGWQKIANPKHYSDPIPLYGGMQVQQSSVPNSNKPPLTVFAVMVNPEILKVNGKNAANPMERDALVSLLCDFVEAMNPGLRLTRRPVVLPDRDLAGELKDVWLAVQAKRQREKGSQELLYKVYDIDGVSPDDMADEEAPTNNGYISMSNQYAQQQDAKKMAARALNQPLRDPRAELEELDNYQASQCYRSYSEENVSRSIHNQRQNYMGNYSREDQTFTKDNDTYSDIRENGSTTGWDEFSKRDISTINTGESKTKGKVEQLTNGKEAYNFYPVFENNAGKAPTERSDGTHDQHKQLVKDVSINIDSAEEIIDPIRKLVLHSTDNRKCDNKTS